jgi:hypothetical protein
MIYRGHVKNGVVVLDDELALPDGTEVRVELSSGVDEEQALDEHGQTLGKKLLKYAGVLSGLPSDLAENHDHYIHGCPKK